jgi:hypothetical protein
MDNKLNQSSISENEIERPLRQEQRLDAITELVLASGTLKIEDLVEQFQARVMTIHRDLNLLDSRGILRKSRGYATAVACSLFEANPEYRQRQNIYEKEMLAQTAFKFVEPVRVLSYKQRMLSVLRRRSKLRGKRAININQQRIAKPYFESRDAIHASISSG